MNENNKIDWVSIIKLVADNGVCKYKYGDNKFTISLSGESFNGDLLEVYEDYTLIFKEKINNTYIDILLENEYNSYDKIIKLIDKLLSDEYDYKIEHKLKIFK